MSTMTCERYAIQMPGRENRWTIVDGPAAAPAAAWTAIDRHPGTRGEDAAARLNSLRARASLLGTTWEGDDPGQLAEDREAAEAMKAYQHRAIEALDGV